MILVEKNSLLNERAYTSFSYDGYYLYFTIEKCSYIAVYDLNLNFVKNIETGTCYKNICYDFNERCFWAYKNKKCIFKLDCCFFKEIDVITFDVTFENLKSLSYNFILDSFILLTANCVYFLNKDGAVKKMGENLKNEFNSCCCCDKDSILKINCYADYDFNVVKILNDKLLFENVTCLPKNNKVIDMIKVADCNCKYILVLTSKSNMYCYILKYLVMEVS